MTSAVGWYGPLIDLSKASLHIGDFVQLVVFVHRITPLQYKSSNGGEVIRTDIQVGDESRPFFSVSLWQKQLASTGDVVYGDVVLMQNVQIVQYRDVVEAKTVTQSSLHRLLHLRESDFTNGVDESIESGRVGAVVKEKLRKVVEWVKKSNVCRVHGSQLLQKRRFPINWKLLDESKKPEECCSVSELSRLSGSCKAVFEACVAEIFMPVAECKSSCDKEGMFVSRRLCRKGDPGLVALLTCTGCRICGMCLETNSGNTSKQNAAALYCSESSNHRHDISAIFRPFMLYVWDDSDYAPVQVKNKAAELLFGNIKAERVSSCYQKNPHDKQVESRDTTRSKQTSLPTTAEGVLVSCSSRVHRNESQLDLLRNMDFYRIWLILLKAMLQQRSNSPLKFVVDVNAALSRENGRFEMVAVQMPCFNKHQLISEHAFQ